MDAFQNLIRVDSIADHTGAGKRVFAYDMLAEKPCQHCFRPSQFEEIERNGKGRTQMGFQMVSRTGVAPQRNY
jgi:hypothetical protein